MFGSRIARAYKKLPPHHNFAELSANIEQLANDLLNQAVGSFGSEGYLKAPDIAALVSAPISRGDVAMRNDKVS